jgi:hypothetical protein
MLRLLTTLLLVLFICAARADTASLLPAPTDPVAALQLPPGFSAEVFAKLNPAGGNYYQGPRFMAFGTDGNLYLSLGLDNKVVMLPDRDHDGRAQGRAGSDHTAPKHRTWAGRHRR